MADHKTSFIKKTEKYYAAANTKRECDIVMKGGITSGAVFPQALTEIAKTYRYKNIGGTSAGALAAVATAAAEYGRQTGGGTSFAGFEKLSKWFGEKPKKKSDNTNLYNLFQPQESTKSLFNIFIATLGAKSPLVEILKTSVKEYYIRALIGSVPGILALIASLHSESDWTMIPTFFASLILIFVGITVSVGHKFYTEIKAVIPKNNYGLCTGSTVENSNGSEALTDWMAELFDCLAGKPKNNPLTYGNLKSKGINLLTMTTCLTHSRPYNIPFDEKFFYFKPSELKDFFPLHIVEWMVEHARDYNDKTDERKVCEQKGIIPLPLEEDLPVIIGARMSLSFPILLSAVPLYSIDHSRKDPEDRRLERVWFSDGGICSNFPIHFFDKAIPNRPTFGINLKGFHPDYPKSLESECENIWMPDNNKSGIHPFWNRFDKKDGNNTVNFLGAIIDSMMSWLDNTQMKIPGYRDRIVHINIADDEGGLQLNMDPKIIKSLGQRGKCAGEKLVKTYTRPHKDDQLSWDNHRWVRLRSTLSLVVESIINLNKSYVKGNERLLKDKTYIDLIKNPPSYKWDKKNPAQKKLADDVIQGLQKVVTHLSKKYEKPEDLLKKGAPKPEPEVRIMPKI